MAQCHTWVLVVALSACASSRASDGALDADGTDGGNRAGSGSAGTGAGGTGSGVGGASGAARDAAVPDAAQAQEPICDGSGDMRLGVTSSGGFVPSTYLFTNPYGLRFLFVDGQCRYYAGIDYMKGVATGTLSDAEAEQLAVDIGWSMLERWSAYVDVQCPDAGATVITRPSLAATCICGCADMGPPGLSDAMNAAGTWLMDLFTRGDQLDGSVSAVARREAGATGRELDWTLSRPIAEIAGFVRDVDTGDVGSGVSFDDPEDVQALRELRSAALAQMQYAMSIPVVDDDTSYTVYARDDLPDGVPAAIDALLESAGP